MNKCLNNTFRRVHLFVMHHTSCVMGGTHAPWGSARPQEHVIQNLDVIRTGVQITSQVFEYKDFSVCQVHKDILSLWTRNED